MKQKSRFKNFSNIGYHRSMHISASSGVQRSGDARGDCLIVCPTTKF